MSSKNDQQAGQPLLASAILSLVRVYSGARALFPYFSLFLSVLPFFLLSFFRSFFPSLAFFFFLHFIVLHAERSIRIYRLDIISPEFRIGGDKLPRQESDSFATNPNLRIWKMLPLKKEKEGTAASVFLAVGVEKFVEQMSNVSIFFFLYWSLYPIVPMETFSNTNICRSLYKTIQNPITVVRFIFLFSFYITRSK